MEAFSITQFSNDTRYTSAVARVRALENRLLTRNKLNRLAEQTTWHSTLEELRSTDYFESLAQVSAGFELEAALSQVLHNRYRLVHELAIQPALIAAILSWYDFSNLKLLLRQRFGHLAVSANLSDLGIISPQQLKLDLESGIVADPLKEIYRRSQVDFDKHSSLPRLQLLVDNGYLRHIREVFCASDIPFLRYFIEHRIDFIRILTVLRNDFWKTDNAGISELLPQGGFLSTERLLPLRADEPRPLIQLLQYSPYASIADSVRETDSPLERIVSLEKQFDDFLSDFLSQARYTAFGVEPLIAFLWASLKEFRNVRLILTANKARVAAETVQTRLRRVYA